MDFVTAVKTCLSKYFDFSGRAIRSEYWFFYLFQIIAMVVASVIDGVLTGGLLYLISSFGLFIPGLAAGIRRLHDLNKSGWWLLIALVPLVGILVLIFWFAGRGTEGENRFGPDPLGGATAAPVEE